MIFPQLSARIYLSEFGGTGPRTSPTFCGVTGKDGRIRDTIGGILLPEEFEQKIRPLLK